ncbi:membrane protein [Lactiplantibacillus brownii]
MALVVGILGLGLLITVPEFWHHAVIMSSDSRIHFTRLEQVYRSLQGLQLPPLVNFFGFGQQGLAVNGMYPWLTAVIFIGPRFLVASPILAMAIGFLLVNWLTGLTSWLLCRQLTSSRRYQLLGVTIYLLNTYHLALLYARTAMGELLAYLFLPLVLLGCLQLWQSERVNRGWLWLAVGMAGIANSHVLSLLVVSLVLGLIEAIRWWQRKLKRSELFGLLKAGIVALGASAYSLGNLIYVSFNNQMTVPFRNLITIDLAQVQQVWLTNRFSEVASSWSVGLPVMVLLGFLVSQWFRYAASYKQETWIPWLKLTLLSIVITLSWWPWEKLAQSPVGVIQFWGRLLCATALLTMVTLVLYCNQHPLKRRTYWSGMAVITLMALSSLGLFNQSMHPVPAGDPHRIVARGTYFQMLNTTSYLPEYHPKSKAGKDVLEIHNQTKLTLEHSTGDRGIYLVETPQKGRVTDLAFAQYRGVTYHMTLNGEPVKSLATDHLRLKLPKRRNQLVVKAQAPSFDYPLIAISLVTWVGLGISLSRKP